MIVEYNLIIELDGNQHFNQVSNWKSCEEVQNNDVYKMKKACENNYSMIRILQMDVYLNKHDWENRLKKSIVKYKKPNIIYICDNNEYDVQKTKFKELL